MNYSFYSKCICCNSSNSPNIKPIIYDMIFIEGQSIMKVECLVCGYISLFDYDKYKKEVKNP